MLLRLVLARPPHHDGSCSDMHHDEIEHCLLQGQKGSQIQNHKLAISIHVPAARSSIDIHIQSDALEPPTSLGSPNIPGIHPPAIRYPAKEKQEIITTHEFEKTSGRETQGQEKRNKVVDALFGLSLGLLFGC